LVKLFHQRSALAAVDATVSAGDPWGEPVIRRTLWRWEYGCVGFAAFDDTTFIRLDSAQGN
jgi:hypothetical protein